MANTIEKGITITFRGDTTEFDKGVSQINSELKGLKSETKLLNKELKLDPNNFDKLSQKLKALQKQEELTKEKIDAYKQALNGMEKGSAEFEKTTRAVRELEVELGYTQKAINNMGGNQVSLALNQMAKGFKEAGTKVEELGKKFAGLSTACAGILTAFGKLSYDVVKSADDINTLSRQTGLSTDTLQAFGQMANLIDVDLNTLSKTAVYVTKNLDNKTAIETYKQLGVAIKDANGNYRDTESILFDSLKALQQVEDETTRNMLASDLFGKSYSALGSIINNASVDLEEITRLVEENGKILSTDELNALNDVNDSIDEMKMKFSALGTSLVAEFKEPLKSLIESISILADKFIAFVNTLSTEQKTTLLQVVTLLATLSPILIIIGKTITAVSKVISVVSKIIQFLLPLLKGLWALIEANPLIAIITAIVLLIMYLVNLYQNNEQFRESINQLGAYIKDIFIAVMNKLREIIEKVVNWIKQMIQKIKDLWEQFTHTEFAETFIAIFNRIFDAVSKVVGALQNVWNWLGKVISKVGDFFSSGIEKVAGWFSSGGFGNAGAFMSGGYGTLELQTTINVNNNGAGLTSMQAQQFGRQIVEYVNEKLGRRI